MASLLADTLNDTFVFDDAFLNDTDLELNNTNVSDDNFTSDDAFLNDTVVPGVTSIHRDPIPFWPLLLIVVISVVGVPGFVWTLWQLQVCGGCRRECSVFLSSRGRLFFSRSPLLLLACIVSLMVALYGFAKTLRVPDTPIGVQVSLLCGILVLSLSICTNCGTVLSLVEHDDRHEAQTFIDEVGANELLRYLPSKGTPEAIRHYRQVKKLCKKLEKKWIKYGDDDDMKLEKEQFQQRINGILEEYDELHPFVLSNTPRRVENETTGDLERREQENDDELGGDISSEHSTGLNNGLLLQIIHGISF